MRWDLENFACKILVRKSERKRPLRRPWRTWEAMNMNVKETDKKMGTGFIWLIMGTTGMNHRVP
jgi:hypothetical protein